MKRIYTTLCAALCGVCAATAQNSMLTPPSWSITIEEGAFKNSQISRIDYFLEGEIGAETFANCHWLWGLSVSAPEPAPCHPTAFKGVNMADKQLQVLAEPGVGSRYREAEGWSRFGDVYSQYFTLSVELKDGSQVSCVFDKHPRLAFNGENAVYTSDEQSLTWSLYDVVRINRAISTDHLVGTPIESIEGERPTFALHDGQVSLSHAKAALRLLTLDGKLLHTAKTDNSGRAAINLRSFPAGIYMVSDGQHTIKVINK